MQSKMATGSSVLNLFSNLNTKPKILIGICLPLVMLVALGGVAINSISSIVGTNKQVDHTHEVLSEASSVVGSAVDMETGMRGYLLAGEEGFLSPYKGGEKATYETIAKLKETVNDNPGQVKRLEEVEATLRAWQKDVTEPTIGLRRKIGDAKTMNDMADLVGEARGKVFFDKFRKQVATFTGREQALLDKRRAEFARAQESVGENFGLVQKTTGWVEHTHKVLADANTILANAVDMETGMRGYLLAGSNEFLDPYKAGRKAFFANVKKLKKTVSDNPAQVARLDKINDLISGWIKNVTDPAIALRRRVVAGSDSMNSVVTLVNKKQGKKYFDAFRGEIAAFSMAEASLMSARQEKAVETGMIVRSDLETMRKNEEWVTHTYNVISRANAMLSAGVDMETGMRGYLLAGQEGFLAPYTGGRKAFDGLTTGLTKTVSDNPAQVALLGEITGTIDGWQKNVTEPTIGLRRKIGNAKTMDDMADLIGEARGKKYFDKFRAIMGDFQAEETGLMEQRQAANESTVTTTFTLVISCIIGAIIVGLGLAIIIGNAIANPVRSMTEAMDRLANGDLEADVPARGRGDEIGKMAEAVQVFKENGIEKVRLEEEEKKAADERQRAEQAERDREEKENAERLERQKNIDGLTTGFGDTIEDILGVVSTQSGEMETSAQSMSEIAQQTLKDSTTVASAAEQTSASVQTVATAAEELSSSIGEIGRQVSHSAQISQKAVEAADGTNTTMRELAEAAQRIGEVVDLINDIANQTNLLALNATIEAARAGDAGKGFAVVASEVKNLASQTAKATEDIGTQIGEIQSTTQDAVTAIEGIGSTISEMNEIATSIASAVEEQGAATDEISRNVQEAAQGTESVTNTILTVRSGSEQTGNASGTVLNASQELGERFQTVRKEVEEFLKKIKAA
jgi:methyl-accepting chemotaxis protein